MGRLFSRYFIRKGCIVYGFDPKGIYIQGLIPADSNSDAVRRAELIIIATPLGTEESIVREVKEDIKYGSYVIEMSSVKRNIILALKSLLKGRANLLSVHPLFGPRVVSLENKKILVIGNRKEAKILSTIFPEADIATCTAEKHDRMMGIMLSLPYIINAAYYSTYLQSVKDKGLEDFLTATASKQLRLARAILSQQPELFANIIAMNKFNNIYLNSFTKQLLELVEKAEGDYSNFLSICKKYNRLARTKNFASSIHY